MQYNAITPKAVKAYRETKGFSQKDLASMLGVEVSTVKRWEKGVKPTGTAAPILETLILGKAVGLAGMVAGSIFENLKDVFDE